MGIRNRQALIDMAKRLDVGADEMELTLQARYRGHYSRGVVSERVSMSPALSEFWAEFEALVEKWAKIYEEREEEESNYRAIMASTQKVDDEA